MKQKEKKYFDTNKNWDVFIIWAFSSSYWDSEAGRGPRTEGFFSTAREAISFCHRMNDDWKMVSDGPFDDYRKIKMNRLKETVF